MNLHLGQVNLQNIGSKVCFDNRYQCFGGNHYVGHVLQLSWDWAGLMAIGYCEGWKAARRR